MADIGDKAADLEQLFTESSLHLARTNQGKVLRATGRCHNCEEPLKVVGQKFCDGFCTQDWEKREAAARRNGSGED